MKAIARGAFIDNNYRTKYNLYEASQTELLKKCHLNAKNLLIISTCISNSIFQFKKRTDRSNKYSEVPI